jgi:tryptophan 2,3-dioxygenase
MEGVPLSTQVHMPDLSMTYSEYLDLDDLLACQHPLSDVHDELLFIIIHQAAELWLKLCLHELDAVRRLFAEDRLSPAFKMLARTSRIQNQLIQSWDVLSTMTPADYQRMRVHLGTSSGFQSYQYRRLEFLLGARDRTRVELYAEAPEQARGLAAELTQPSLYDAALALLARRGLPVPDAVLQRPLGEAYVPDSGVEACWAVIYGDLERYWDLYELAEKLMDLEQKVQIWRYGHLKTVERIIGFKGGTGGSSGVGYLSEVLTRGFFPELLSVRTVL